MKVKPSPVWSKLIVVPGVGGNGGIKVFNLKNVRIIACVSLIDGQSECHSNQKGKWENEKNWLPTWLISICTELKELKEYQTIEMRVGCVLSLYIIKIRIFDLVI